MWSGFLVHFEVSVLVFIFHYSCNFFHKFGWVVESSEAFFEIEQDCIVGFFGGVGFGVTDTFSFY